MNRFYITLIMVLPFLVNAQSKEVIGLPQLGKSPVEEVINAMTLDEKLNFIKGTGMKISMGGGGSAPVAGSIGGNVPGAAGSTFAIPRLGIPAMVLADGPAGLRIDSSRVNESKRYYATAFPVGTSLASTWNTDLVYQLGEAMGNEVLEYGVDIILGPAMNMHRNPLGGRNFEYYSEDPLVTGKIGAAMVNGIQSNGVGTSIKHFAVNDQESNRNNVDAVVSERAVREIYLKPFEITVEEANPWTVMSSYNKINGIYASENYELLSTILRDEWGFEGLVMTDWFAGKDFPAQMKAGNDLLMPGRKSEARKIKEALEAGELNEEVLNRNIEHILNIILKSPSYKKYNYSDAPNLTANAKMVREISSEGMVLLKNNNKALPILGSKIALLGNTSYDLFIGGTGSGEVNKAYAISLYQGLYKRGYKLDETLKQDYETYIRQAKAALPTRRNILETIKPVDECGMELSQLEKLAEENDVALVTIGRNAGEGKDREINFDYYLTPAELKLLETTSKAFHSNGKSVVVVLNIDAVIDVASWRDLADAILVVWQPGQEAGNAITDVVSGKVNPSGKLATTFPMSYNDVPSAQSFPGIPADRPVTSIYNEGIYVGYRYYNTFDIKPAYAFGHGLSYTTFKFDKLKLNSKEFVNKLDVSLEVTNTGDIDGKEVIQMYISAPGKSMDKPVIELKDFFKTKLLKPGESQEVKFEIQASDLASFDTDRTAWVSESGIYSIQIGTSSNKILLRDTFSLKSEIIIENVNKVLIPQTKFNELKAIAE